MAGSSTLPAMPLRWREETQTLEGWAQIHGRRQYVRIPRDMIHALQIYNDAIGWEIERFKDDIVQRLVPQLSQTEGLS